MYYLYVCPYKLHFWSSSKLTCCLDGMWSVFCPHATHVVLGSNLYWGYETINQQNMCDSELRWPVMIRTVSSSCCNITLLCITNCIISSQDKIGHVSYFVKVYSGNYVNELFYSFYCTAFMLVSSLVCGEFPSQ